MHPNPSISPDRQTDYLDPLSISPVTPPPVQVVHKGWFRTTTTYRQAADLIREDREREQRENR